MISVLLPVYNDERYIRSSLQSVTDQTCANLEILVGFNGTVDRSKEIVQGIRDERIRIFDFGSSAGKARTLNKLLANARGDWIALQDGDDVWLPDKLGRQVKHSEDADVIGTYIRYIDEKGEIIGKPTLYTTHEQIVRRCRRGDNQIANSSAIVRRSVAVNANGWDEEKDVLEDYDFWLRLIDMECRFFNVPEFCVHHRLHQGSNFNTRGLRLDPVSRRVLK